MCPSYESLPQANTEPTLSGVVSPFVAARIAKGLKGEDLYVAQNWVATAQATADATVAEHRMNEAALLNGDVVERREAKAAFQAAQTNVAQSQDHLAYLRWQIEIVEERAKGFYAEVGRIALIDTLSQ